MVENSNIFKRLFRQSRGEDHLTESLAVLCERSEPFLRSLMGLFVSNVSTSHTAHFATQSSYSFGRGTKFIDFEFWTEDRNGNREFTGFIEVKWHSLENFSAGSNDEIVMQTTNYAEILSNHQKKLGGKAGLFSLTPAFNPLAIEVDETFALTFVPSKNVYWDEIGRLAQSFIDSADDPVTGYLSEQFVNFLQESGLMIDTKLSIQDVFVASHYIDVKAKIWSALQKVSDHLGKNIHNSTTNSNSYSTASTQESQHARFMVYRYLTQETGFAIMAGLLPRQADIASVCVWIEINPKFADQVDKISSTIRKNIQHVIGDWETNAENTWVVTKPGTGWQIAYRSNSLASYSNGDDGLSRLSADLCTWVNELLAIKDLASLGAATFKKAG